MELLTPNQLDSLLGLFQRVTGKYFNIAKILGIEGGYGLTEDQELPDLSDFNEMYLGKRTVEEELRLKYQDICREYPEHRVKWQNMPTRTVSGKRQDGRFAFFCYSIHGKRLIDGEAEMMKFGLWKTVKVAGSYMTLQNKKSLKKSRIC